MSSKLVRMPLNNGKNDSKDVDNKKTEEKEPIIERFLKHYYDVEGETCRKDFKTSAELVYMLREHEEVSMRDINRIMEKLGFELKFVSDSPHWIVYIRDINAL